MKHLAKLRCSHSTRTMINASLLINDIQNALSAEYKSGKCFIDLVTFLKSKSQMAQIKEQMVEQTDLQIKICQEIMKGTPNLGKIVGCAKESWYHRKTIEKKIKNVISISPEYYIDPLITYAYYCSLVTHSPTNYFKYQKLYLHKYKAYH